jgi:hypothetical protein
MTIYLAHEADLIADALIVKNKDHGARIPTDWDDLRDCCDIFTQSGLDCFQLDMLTDLVGARLRKAAPDA